MAKKKAVTGFPKVPLSKAELKKYKEEGVVCLIRFYYEGGLHKTDFGRPVNVGYMTSLGEKDYWEIAYKVLPHFIDENDPTA
jgi:hypothetical protein